MDKPSNNKQRYKMKFTNQERQEKYEKYNSVLERDNLSEQTEEIIDLCIQNLEHEEALDNLRALRESKAISRDMYELTMRALFSKKQEIINQLTAIRNSSGNTIEA
jgi:hypothetical protein